MGENDRQEERVPETKFKQLADFLKSFKKHHKRNLQHEIIPNVILIHYPAPIYFISLQEKIL